MLERRSLPNLGGIFRKSKKTEKKEKVKVEAKGVYGKAYLKAMPLRDLSDLDTVKSEVTSGNILILRVTPLANKSIEDVKRAVNELCEFAESVGGDIARLGEERVVICPSNVRIWREKTPVSNEPIPTAA
ncbi:MAG: cell division protein SepF [Candidatus Bathyarchaeales archaeon]